MLAGLGWFALIGQLYLILAARTVSIPETLIRYFSFFTIQTNILVALCCTVLVWLPAGKWGRFFSRASVQAALTVYIGIVGLVYNTILRFLWAPQGLQRGVDELLHLVIPVLFILYWLLYAPKKDLAWKQLPSWLIYPAAYMLYTIVHGAITNYYPYPFVDVAVLGYPVAMRNAAGVVLLFLAASAGVIALGRALAKRSAAAQEKVSL
ncbi:hypothetical protein EGT74_04205 [Chitinophaga lutea]|uniref:Pr6Pr family membrane protein n=1 Tax=Chitinophaga lutea TaxID=2488634 RepID=A0A3N4QM31_9BACT|nr:hypothetical protein EGT74_04205 [Chitinophaga lutea]